MKLERYCTCGQVLKIDVPKRKYNQVCIVWYNQHAGPGHGDTTAAEAERVRMGYGQAMGREKEKE